MHKITGKQSKNFMANTNSPLVLQELSHFTLSFKISKHNLEDTMEFYPVLVGIPIVREQLFLHLTSKVVTTDYFILGDHWPTQGTESDRCETNEPTLLLSVRFGTHDIAVIFVIVVIIVIGTIIIIIKIFQCRQLLFVKAGS